MSGPHPSAQASDPNYFAATDYNQYLPQFLQSTSGSVLPTEQTLLDANKVLTPQQSQLALDNYKNFAPQFAAAGAQVQQAAGQSNLGLLSSVAPALGKASYEANIAGDPYTEQNRQRISGGLNTLFGSLGDPNAISGSEHSNIQRSLDRNNFARGNEAPSATSTVESAMKYGAAGDALKQQKQSAINSAIGSAVGSSPALSTGVNSTSLALGGAQSNPGLSQFSGPTSAGGTEFNFGNSLMGNQTTGLSASLNADANRKQWDERVNGAIGSFCCFIFMEAYGGNIPWYVRKSRDIHYTFPIRTGYVWMSKWLVPAMKRSRTVRALVNALMIKPLTNDAAFVCDVVNTPNPLARKFWLGLWSFLGYAHGLPVAHGRCLGRKWSLGHWQIEHWTVPAGEFVEPHTHSKFDSTIIPLSGWAGIMRAGASTISRLFKAYKIPAGVNHSLLNASEQPFTFINIEHWSETPTSAATDFQLTY